MRRIALAGTVLLLALAGAGCGGSDDAASDAAGNETATEESTLTDTSASTEAMTTDTEETSTDSVGGLGGLKEECGDLVEASQAFGAAVASAMGSGNDGLGDTAELYQSFAENAPDELQDDFQALAGLMSEYAEAIADLDLQAGETPSAAQIAQLVTIGQSLSTPEAQEATAAISAWTQENC